MIHRLLAACTLSLLALSIEAGTQPVAAAPDAKAVMISGTVADEVSRGAILAKLKAVYGEARIIDALEVGGVAPPPNWTAHVTALLEPGIRQIQQGQIEINGTRVTLQGKVANEAHRHEIVSTTASVLTPAYTVTNALTLSNEGQAALDQTLADRVVEFDSGAATLTATGVHILDEMAATIMRHDVRQIQIIGHTDHLGSRLANIALSLERAHAVRNYLLTKGIDGSRMTPLGAGPDRPVADNDTAEGRARNRRIEFRTSG